MFVLKGIYHIKLHISSTSNHHLIFLFFILPARLNHDQSLILYRHITRRTTPHIMITQHKDACE